MKPRALVSWSSGKDAAWTLHLLRQQEHIEVVALLTTFDQAADRVGMHGVPRALVEAQAAAAGLPLVSIPLPWPAANTVYEAAVGDALAAARRDFRITHVAFGDLYLLGDEVALPGTEVGDLVVVFQAGAYGLTASPTAFLGHPAPAEVLV